MIVYIYDGSFDGLLTCIYYAFYAKEKPEEIIRKEFFEENFVAQKKHIETDSELASRVYNAIEKKISANSLKRVFYSYLSELPNSEMMILKYLQIGFKIGKDTDLHLANEHVLNIDKIAKRVSKERHRLTGLLRFKSIKNGLLYAQVEPDHNVIGLTAEHFKSRLKSQNFVIHDTKREIGVFYNKKEWMVTDINKADSVLVRDSEEIYEELWKTYFQAISIERKKNPKLQKNHMPKRYWKNLVEKN